MNISALQMYANLFSTAEISDVTKTQSTNNTQSLTKVSQSVDNRMDSVSISPEGLTLSKMTPPPQNLDFENMSDEDLTDFLEKMQQYTGHLPGVEEGTVVSDLTSEQLQDIRDVLTYMSTQMGKMHGTGKMQGQPPPPPLDIQSMSKDDFITLLEKIKEETGAIPGIADSESTEVSSLTEEQIQDARDALAEMMKKRIEEMMQSLEMSRAISAYGANGAVTL